MRWTRSLEVFAEFHVRKAFGTPPGAPAPPVRYLYIRNTYTYSNSVFFQYITIHSRRDDFRAYCGDFPVQECYPSMPVIARRVREVQEELRERKGIDVKHVIMTSDERDPAWWAEVKAEGWYVLDYSRTIRLLGPW